MGNPETLLEIPLEISDVSGQKVFSVANAPTGNTVGELVHEMLGKMNLPRNDASGAPLTYQARSGERRAPPQRLRAHRRRAGTRRQIHAATEHRCGTELLTGPAARTPNDVDVSISLCDRHVRRGRDQPWHRAGEARLAAGGRVDALLFPAKRPVGAQWQWMRVHLSFRCGSTRWENRTAAATACR